MRRQLPPAIRTTGAALLLAGCMGNTASSVGGSTGNAVVQVNVELETLRETIVERRIDPESRVAISTETDERNNTSRDGTTNGVTVASNLPEGDTPAGGESSTQGSETRERVTFDMSELQREVAREPGDIRRISVAVLLNGVRAVGADGQASVDPRPEAEIAALEALVQSAIGFNAERGDSVTIESMAFDDAALAELEAPGFTDRMSLDLGRVLQSLVLAGAALFIAFGLLRPLLRRAPQGAVAAGGVPVAALSNAGPGMAAEPGKALAASEPTPPRSALAPPQPASETPDETAPIMSPATPPSLPAQSQSSTHLGTESRNPVDRLRRLIEEREDETIEILRSWMEEDEEVQP